MKPISIYDPARYETIHAQYTQAQRIKGGLSRSKNAIRDKWGRMLPNNPTTPLHEPINHGMAGGKARVGKAKRNKLGQFTKG